MQTNECFMCGSNDFIVIDGAFVCNECGIQSQAIREEQIAFCDVINTVHDGMADKDHEITSGSQLEKEKKLLSWECFNLILLGLTNEIIELGAKPSLKVIVLQLWVRYLQCIEAAFVSKKNKKIPKFSTTINNVDCQILYGVENIKTKILHAKTGIKRENQKVKRRSNKRKSMMSNKSSASSLMTISQKRSRMTQKLRKMDNSTRDLDNDSMLLSDDVSLLQRSIKSSKIKVKLMKNVKKSIKSLPSKTEGIADEESAMLLKSGRKNWTKLKKKEKKNVVSIKTIISIIRLALMINNDDIYLSDILRWIREGHFHVNRINLFLPENAVHGIHFIHMVHISTRNGLNIDLAELLNHLEASQLPDTDFKKLAIRFCDELQLPEDFTHFVCKLLLIHPPNIKCKRLLPDVEVKVMTYILFAAKFLFCLDGNAEKLSSNFAEKINESNKVGKKLFNWNNYVQYVECRNSIISQYNYLLHKNVYGNNVRNTQTFINDWNISTSTKTLKDKELSRDFKEKTEYLIQSLPDIGKKSSYREIPASTKPLSSTLKWIFEYYSMQLSVEAKIILKSNFTQTDVLYLADEKRIHDLAEECGVPVEVNCNRPLHYMKQQKEDIETIKPPKLYTSQTKIRLSDEPINKKEHNNILNNSYEEEKPNTIFLGTGLNYWFIHMRVSLLKQSDDITKINSIFKQKLPYSFLWFMNLCCRILNCTLSNMYVELMNLEKNLSNFLEAISLVECEDTSSGLTL